MKSLFLCRQHKEDCFFYRMYQGGESRLLSCDLKRWNRTRAITGATDYIEETKRALRYLKSTLKKRRRLKQRGVRSE